tara:strand:+ start:142222 stop:144999 length:2778 start_codon:yes stop_codon:yes gene_type:complete
MLRRCVDLVKLILGLFIALLVGCGDQPKVDEDPIEDPGSLDPILEAVLSATPSTLNFGNVVVGSSQNQTITIVNSGNGSASDIFGNPLPNSIKYAGGAFPGSAGTCGATLSAGNSCTLDVVFSPVSTGAANETLTLVFNEGSGTNSVNIDLSGMGVATAALSFVEGSNLDFGSVTLGTSAELTLNVLNSSVTSATAMDGAILSSEFSYKGGAYPGTGGDCGVSLAGGSSCSIVLEFSPTADNSFSEDYSLSFDDGSGLQSLAMSLEGTGVLPAAPIITGVADDSMATTSKTWSWGCDQTCEYRYAINTSSTHTFSSEAYSGVSSATQPTGDSTYYLHVQARSLPYLVESDVITVSAVLDNTAPTDPVIISFENDATEELAATMNFTDSTDSSLSHYMLAVGTLGTADNIVPFTNVGLSNPLQFDAGSYVFANGTEYYTSIYAVDVAGNVSSTVTSVDNWQPPGPPEAISNLGVSSAGPFELTIGWTAPFNNHRAITDYLVEYRAKGETDWLVFNDGVNSDTVVTVDGLLEQTIYEFRVTAYNGSQAPASNIAEGETTIDDPFFDPTQYKAMNLGGATQSAIVNIGEEEAASIDIERNGEIINLGVNVPAGGVINFDSEQYDIAISDQPLFVAGRRGNSGAGDNFKGNIVWNTPDWAGKTFVFNGTRDNPHEISFYSFEDGNTIKFYKGNTEIQSYTIEAGEADTYSLADNGGFRIESTGLMVAFFVSSNGGRAVDPKPLLPASSDILGIPSRSAYLATQFDSTSYNFYRSDSSTGSGTANANQAKNIAGAGTVGYYQEHSLRIISTDVSMPVVANSNADANGYCSAPFIPVGMMKKKYGLNVQAEWIAFASLEGGDITVIAPDGTETTHAMVQSGSNPYAPFKLRFTNLPAGTRFKADFRFAGWYEPKTDSYGADNDETIMFGAD